MDKDDEIIKRYGERVGYNGPSWRNLRRVVIRFGR
jgi:hypothetical protein